MSASIVINNTTGTGVTVKVSTITLNSLTDVVVSGIQDSDRLVYDEATGTWVNKDKIDGGHFT